MKLSYLALSIFAASTLSLSAVTTVTISNLDTISTSDNAITDNAGMPIAIGSGSIQIGYFMNFTSIADFTGISVSTLLNDFQSFGSTTESFENDFDAEGFFSSVFTDTIQSGDEIIGQTLVTVIGDNSSLSNSSEFLVFSHDGITFQEEVAGVGGIGALVQAGQGSLLLGSEGGVVSVLNTDVGSFNLETVPEPSSTALLALAGVGLALRRRR